MSGELSDRIREEIAVRGPISFARFMEMALYFPELGYYERSPRVVGRGGDFYTSVTSGSVFGELLAFQFVEWSGRLAEHSGRWQIVEAGAHDGQLAFDILSWIDGSADPRTEGMEYWIIEPSDRRRRWQQEKLAPFANRVRWRESLSELHNVRGVIFSNELLDAFSVHRFGWDATACTWFEWGVTWNAGRFCWSRLPGEPMASVAPEIPRELLPYLPDGYIAERSPAAERWWASASAVLATGKLLTFDYGLSADELVVPERLNGTVRAYRQHHVSTDLLADPGEQDLTAHVQFGNLQDIGERAGLRTDRFCRQSEFLVAIAENAWRQNAQFAAWTADKRRQFQTLIHPEHLGRSFRVLVQSRNDG